MVSYNKFFDKNFLSLLDMVIIADAEMIKHNGEDAFAYSFNENGGFLAVYDGCGGLGSRKYEKFASKSGAFIASRVASESVCCWFSDFSDKDRRLNHNTISNIKNEIFKALQSGLRCFKEISSTTTSMIKGSMTREFPTTASIILCDYIENRLNVSFLWAGDSRGYKLDENGMIQITEDDIEGHGDAFLNLKNDAKLENVISADGEFILNSREIECTRPVVLITATDGCFGYFSTPMEFEYMIVETLVKANNTREWKNNLIGYMRQFACDDFTLGIAAFGYGEFENLKTHFTNRYKILYEKYISKLDDSDSIQIQSMWNEYKQYYYRGAQ